MIDGPPARWIAPSTPPPPASRLFAALTIASTCCCVMSPSTNSSARPLIVATIVLETFQESRLCHPEGALATEGSTLRRHRFRYAQNDTDVVTQVIEPLLFGLGDLFGLGI